MKNTPAPARIDNPDTARSRAGQEVSRVLPQSGVLHVPLVSAAVLFVFVLSLSVFGCSSEPTMDDVRSMQAAGQYKSTLRPLRDWIDLKTQDPEVYFLYGRALSATNEYDAALWPLRKAMESEDWLVRAGMQLATNAFDAANHQTAIEALDRVLEVSPEDVSALVLRSRARVESRQNLEMALADADRALEVDPDASRARIARVLSLLALERVEEAGTALEEIENFAFETAPEEEDSARFCGARASFAKEKGEPELADERYTKCLGLFPSSGILIGDALKFYDGRQEIDRAIEILQAAVEDAPDSRDFRVSLARRLGAVGRDDEALEVLRSATDSPNPGIAAGAWMDVAGFLIDRERLDEGVEAFEKVLAATPNPGAEVLFRYADVLLAAERYDEASSLVETIRVPAHQHLVRGRVHLAREEFGLALDEFSEAFKTWPENAVARYYAALAAEGIGDFDRAIEEYRYSIRAGASQTDARLRLSQLYAAEGAFNFALAILRHDLTSHQSDPDMAELELEIISTLGGAGAIPPHLSAVINRPEAWQRAVAAIARGTNVRTGPKDAAKFIADTGVDFTDPANARVLRDYTRYLVADGRAAEAVAKAEASVVARPNEAVFHAILGLVSMRDERNADDAGAIPHADQPIDVSKAKAEFARALELDPNEPYALAGTASIAEAAGEKERALDYFLRADVADPTDSAPLQQAIDIQIALGRGNDAEANLEKILERKPYSGPAALRLVELRVARGAEKESRSRVLAKLAMRFGGKGPAAAAVLKKSRGAS